MKRKRPPVGDGWFDSEEPTRVGMVAELQRMKRRLKVRPVPVVMMAILLTVAVGYKVITKPREYHANIVLAISQGALQSDSAEHTIPFDQLREYVMSVLLPDAEIEKLIAKRNPGRIDKVGAPFAIQDFRENIEIEIWKNSFIYYNPEDENANKSARIGIDVTDLDPDRAYEIAQELASIVIKSHEEQRRKVSKALAQEIATMREVIDAKLEALSSELAEKTAALDEARRVGRNQLAATLLVEVATVERDQKRVAAQAKQIAASPDANADRVTAAGLDVSIEVVDQRRPDRPEKSGFLLAMLFVVVGTGATVGSTMLIGAFDSRVHDTDDVTRLGLPILGHVPGFPGDHVGSLEARGAARARVPSFLRWRSHR
jgi:capsular polysaccharide biosynthesis protein